MTDLKPCPFCGCKDVGEINTNRSPRIHCYRCGADGPIIPYAEDTKFWTWNTRKGDGCANMTAHKERAVGDEELLEWLRRMSPRLDMLDCENVLTAADRIEALIAERDRWKDACRSASRDLNIVVPDNDRLKSERDAAEAKLAECEARLRKAVEALEWYDDPSSQGDVARATLAEIKGQTFIARIAALTDGGTEYANKVAQMKDDFPNGI